MSKKLNVNEISVLSSVIREKISNVKYEKIRSEIESDVDYLKLEELNKEIGNLNRRIIEINSEFNSVSSRVREKFNVNICKDYNLNNGIKVNVIENYNNKIYNELVLMNISKDFNVEDVIDKIVEKYS